MKELTVENIEKAIMEMITPKVSDKAFRTCLNRGWVEMTDTCGDDNCEQCMEMIDALKRTI